MPAGNNYHDDKTHDLLHCAETDTDWLLVLSLLLPESMFACTSNVATVCRTGCVMNGRSRKLVGLLLALVTVQCDSPDVFYVDSE